MERKDKFRVLLTGVGVCCLILFAWFLCNAEVADAQTGKSFHWQRYDYDVEILQNGDMLFTVDMLFSFDSGSFSQGYYAFDLDRMDDVRDVEVWEGAQAYRQVGSEAEGGYTVSKDDGTFEVLWWFPPTTGGERAFTLKFRVIGGLRIYEGGDQFYWNFYSGDRPARIEEGTITVHLPAEFSPDQLRLAADPGDVTVTQSDSRTVVANVQSFPAYTTAVLRVQFPHGVVQANPSSWQVAEDRRLEYNERWRPVVELALLALSALVLLGGLGGVIALWYTRGRDYPAGIVAEYISELPSNLPPGLAGTLVDEKAEVRDILATVVDLARRGVIEIEEVEESGFLGIGSKRDFIYRRLSSQEPLLPYEQTVIREVFGSLNEIKLSDLKNKFYRSIPRISKEMYAELTQREFFSKNPESTRNAWRGAGVAGMVASFVLFICGGAWFSQYADTFFCFPLASGIVFLAVMIVGGAMPRKTEKGATEAATWQAFKRYLEDIDRYDNLEEKAQIFDSYLPYAIAFGVEKSYINKFSRVEAPAPIWYRPYPPIILDGRRPTTGAGVPVSDVAGGGMPSLQGMSNSMASSLQNMSDGLQSMLNSAANTLTSQPRSSGSGSSGGWSGGGGGFGGGGGGGGGSGVR